MHERGYPVEDFDERADLVTVDHPDVVQHYRNAHEAHERHRASGDADTEDLRQAFVHYRSLFDSLVGRESTPVATTPATVDDEPVADRSLTTHDTETVTDTTDPAGASAGAPVERVETVETVETVEPAGTSADVDERDRVQRADRSVDVTDVPEATPNEEARR
jgi:hypothetical protein